MTLSQPRPDDRLAIGAVDPQSLALLFKSGNSAMRRGDYTGAIAALTSFLHSAKPGSREFGQAQMALVKAYEADGQTEAAIGLCQDMAESPAQATRLWSQQYLTRLRPVVQEEGAEPQGSDDVGALIQSRSLAEFKQFCHENLADDLREFEKRRKQVLKQIIVVEIIVGLILVGLLCLAPALLNYGLNNVRCERRSPIAQQHSPSQSSLSEEDIAQRTGQTPKKEEIKICHNPTKTGLTDRVFIRLLLVWLGGIMLVIWAGVAFLTSSMEAYSHGFKGRIIQKIVDFINPDRKLVYSKYSDQQAIASLINSRQFPRLERGGRAIQDDCVSGRIGKTDLFFSEMRAEVEVANSSISKLHHGLSYLRPDNPITAPLFVFSLIFRLVKAFFYVARHLQKKQQIHYKHFEDEVIYGINTGSQVFKGLFFIADFNKHFQGETFVLSNNLGSTIIQALQQLEDPTFRTLFSTYSNDQVEARYILSTSLMERIVKLRRKANRKIQISFVDSLIYIAIAYEEDLFEPQLFKSMLDLRPMQEYFETLQLMLNIVEDLNLNHRIWTKQ
jgi:hypothetical protein